MASTISVGYLQPAEARIQSEPVEIRWGDRSTTDMTVPDWHYLTDIAVEWVLDIDLYGVIMDCGLTAEARIGAMVAWRSEKTNLRGKGPVINVATGQNVLTAVVPGGDLGSAVIIDARVVLLEIDSAAEQLAPARAGSLLWSESHRVILEGSGGRFPTTATNFAEAGLPGGNAGMWYLEVADSDLGASFTQALRLHLNSANPTVHALLEKSVDEKNNDTLRFLRYETARQLLTLGLSNEEFDDRAEYDRGTLGDVLVTILRLYFPGRSAVQLRNDYTLHPAEIDADLLAVAWEETA